METACSSETFLFGYECKRRHSPEKMDLELQLHPEVKHTFNATDYSFGLLLSPCMNIINHQSSIIIITITDQVLGLLRL
jgi:hypothetical protein